MYSIVYFACILCIPLYSAVFSCIPLYSDVFCMYFVCILLYSAVFRKCCVFRVYSWCILYVFPAYSMYFVDSWCSSLSYAIMHLLIHL